MKNLTLLIVLSTTLLFSQNKTIIENKSTAFDTVIGNRFDFIKPRHGIKVGSDFGEDDKQPMFKKCSKRSTTMLQRKCFSDVFYGTLRNHLKLEKMAKDNDFIDIEVSFVMHESGEITNIAFPKSNDTSGNFEKEVVRVLHKLPKFDPGIIDGKPVSVLFSFPLYIAR